MKTILSSLALFSVAVYGQSTIIDTVYPSLIIPCSEDAPDTAYHTQYSGNITRIGGAHQVSILPSPTRGIVLNRIRRYGYRP